ncbi:hypothetical protein HY632_00235 [Candidatus Uhrbacteria bacterium]|nr:hypothetical protein [Candidatus Uhrbacteria bacterium]
MHRTETHNYRGKHFTVPRLYADNGITIVPQRNGEMPQLPTNHPILQSLNAIWDLRNFTIPRRPLALGTLTPDERHMFSARCGVPRVLDLPIKFPGSEFRIPRALAQFAPTIQRIATIERAINPCCYDEYYCYVTVEQGPVPAGKLQREAPCHVDGFQGARWNPKVRGNHTYVVADALPTVYYEQPFDFSALQEETHNFFWEMNRQVAATNSAHAWRPQPYELHCIDCYTVHRGDVAPIDTFRTWLRCSFEVRIFDRLGNAHNPLFAYDWHMVPRDIEALHLVAFDPDSDPSLRVFPWQRTDGTPHGDPQMRTQPNLMPGN